MPYLIRPTMDEAEHSVVRFRDLPKEFKETQVLYNGTTQRVDLISCFAQGIPVPEALSFDFPSAAEIFPTKTGRYSDYSQEGSLGASIVSAGVLEMLHLLEPAHHQSICIAKMFNERGVLLADRYYALNIERVGGVDLNGADVEVKHFATSSIHAIKQGLGRDPRLTLFSSAIMERHLWRCKLGELAGGFFCSDKFHELWQKRKLVGLKFFECDEI